MENVNITGYGKRVNITLCRKNVIKNLERQHLPWIIRVVALCNHTYDYKRERKGVFTQLHIVDVKTKVEIGMTRPQARERLQPPEGKKCEEKTLELLEGTLSCQHSDFRLLSFVTVR